MIIYLKTSSLKIENCHLKNALRLTYSLNLRLNSLVNVTFMQKYIWCISVHYYSLRSIFIKDKVEPVMTSLHEITNGLTCFNMLDVLKSNIRLFEKAFCPSTILDWTQEELVECLMPEFSKEESNKKRTEVNPYKSFIDFVGAVSRR